MSQNELNLILLWDISALGHALALTLRPGPGPPAWPAITGHRRFHLPVRVGFHHDPCRLHPCRLHPPVSAPSTCVGSIHLCRIHPPVSAPSTGVRRHPHHAHRVPTASSASPAIRVASTRVAFIRSTLHRRPPPSSPPPRSPFAAASPDTRFASTRLCP